MQLGQCSLVGGEELVQFEVQFSASVMKGK